MTARPRAQPPSPRAAEVRCTPDRQLKRDVLGERPQALLTAQLMCSSFTRCSMYFSPSCSETSSLPRGAQRATVILKAQLYSRPEFAFPELLNASHDRSWRRDKCSSFHLSPNLLTGPTPIMRYASLIKRPCWTSKIYTTNHKLQVVPRKSKYINRIWIEPLLEETLL